MASSRDRQRALAREKLDRQLARRAARARRQRQIRAGIAAAIALIVIIGGGLWLGGVFDEKPEPPAAIGDCTWQDHDGDSVKDVGRPPVSGMAKTGVAPVAITSNLGAITAEFDAETSPCGTASFSYLASKQFFDNTKCHRLSTDALFVLQCGSANGDGSGEPDYTFASENLPQPDPAPSPGAAKAQATYPAGTIALVNQGGATNGSQFMIFYKDTVASPAYSIIGKVTSGLDLIVKAAESGAVDASGKTTTDGRPKNDIIIQTMTVAAPTQSAT